jgi:hypothetical protein
LCVLPHVALVVVYAVSVLLLLLLLLLQDLAVDNAEEDTCEGAALHSTHSCRVHLLKFRCCCCCCCCCCCFLHQDLAADDEEEAGEGAALRNVNQDVQRALGALGTQEAADAFAAGGQGAPFGLCSGCWNSCD